jgi:hypothetical protein
VRLDERLEVEVLTGEGVGALAADRADDVRRVAAGDLRRQGVLGDVVVDELDDQLDVVVLFVELGDQLLLALDLGDLGAGAETDEPAHDGRPFGRGAAGRLGRWGR